MAIRILGTIIQMIQYISYLLTAPRWPIMRDRTAPAPGRGRDCSMADAEDESTDVWRQGRPGGPGSRGVSAGGGWGITTVLVHCHYPYDLDTIWTVVPCPLRWGHCPPPAPIDLLRPPEPNCGPC